VLRFIKNLTKALGTKRTLLTAYHSQIEWINQEVEVFLQHYVNYQKDNWIEWLSVVEFQYNDKKYTATGYTLFKLNFGRYL